MFPLQRVVLPSGLIPLRIFEPRYKEMFTPLDEEGASFGTVLIAAGPEVGGEDRRCEVGSLVEIVDRDFGGDLWELVGRAVSRIRIVEWLDSENYPLAVVEDLIDDGPLIGDEKWAEVVEIFRDVLGLCVTHLSGRWDPQMPLSSDQQAAAMEMAEVLPISTLDCYKVLSSTDPAERTATLLDACEGLVEMMGPEPA